MLVGETVEKIKIDTIPADLRMRRQWVLWRYGKMRSNGKREKPIFMPNGRPASVADPATWTTFAKACVACERGNFEGAGITLVNGLVGVDLDNCRDPKTGVIKLPWAREIIRKVTTYWEASPSDTETHRLGRGKKPRGNCKRGDVEMYDASSPHYFTVTGRHLDGTPTTIEYYRGRWDTEGPLATDGLVTMKFAREVLEMAIRRRLFRAELDHSSGITTTRILPGNYRRAEEGTVPIPFMPCRICDDYHPVIRSDGTLALVGQCYSPSDLDADGEPAEPRLTIRPPPSPLSSSRTFRRTRSPAPKTPTMRAVPGCLPSGGRQRRSGENGPR